MDRIKFLGGFALLLMVSLRASWTPNYGGPFGENTQTALAGASNVPTSSLRNNQQINTQPVLDWQALAERYRNYQPLL